MNASGFTKETAQRWRRRPIGEREVRWHNLPHCIAESMAIEGEDLIGDPAATAERLANALDASPPEERDAFVQAVDRTSMRRPAVGRRCAPPTRSLWPSGRRG